MKTKFLLIILLLTVTISLTSCASKKELKEKPVIEKSENFIADLDSFFIGNLNLYTKRSINNPVITQFDVYFYPRSNSIALFCKLGIDVIQIVFSYADRENIYETAQLYLSNYENNLIKEEKPTSKNAYLKGSLPIAWGVFGYTYSETTKYQINTEYLWIEKPYYRLKLDATSTKDESATFAGFSIYVSPSQWQSIFEMCDQATLEAKCDEKSVQADTF